MNRAKRLKIKGIYFLYRTLQAFGLPAFLFYFLYRAGRARGYARSLPERLGFLPHSFRQTGPGAIWLHAVSVGEILSCVEFVRRLRQEFPRTRIFVSASTLAGRATADDKLRDSADGIFYAPVDYVWAVRRVLRALQPSVVLVAETEIWPNLFREVKRTGAGLLLVNGRISDKAWPRYRRLDWVFRAVLPQVDGVLAQTEAIRERFVAIGAPEQRTRAAGNFKFDFQARAAGEESPAVAFLRRTGARKVWIAASTMPPAVTGDQDEDDVVIAAFREVATHHPDMSLILAPRKPERFSVVAEKLRAAGLRFVRRGSGLPPDPGEAGARVLLLDTIGELSGLFAYADVVFMGGTLAHRGGHNILEPALFGKPVVIGPHMENFQAVADEFRAAGACVGIADSTELGGAVKRLLDNPQDAAAIGRRALQCAEASRGATARAVQEIRTLFDRCIPRYRPGQPWFAIRWLLARVWQWGTRRKQARDLARRRSLPVPVISIGNLTMGGTGKTPCVLRLTELLRKGGRQPAILTRGYGRTSHEKRLAVAPGATARAEQTGDEPQMFVRSGLAPVGVGADRFETGRLVLARFSVDVVLLDDGFQHLRLARDLDIVLVDALNPWGGGDVFPLGRLREPFEGIARAGLVLITRSDLTDTADAVERAVRLRNPDAPIFRGKVHSRAWVEHRSGKRYPPDNPPFGRAAGFCGVGNPQSFRRTLEALGVTPVEFIPFEDHHRYRPHELRRITQHSLAAGATALVTTEKDTINLCPDCDNLLDPLPLYWLQVAMAIDREDDFIGAVERVIERKLKP